MDASPLLVSSSAPSVSRAIGLVTGFEVPVDRSLNRVLRPCEMSGSVSQLLLPSTVSNPDQLASVVAVKLGQVELVVVDEPDLSVLHVRPRCSHRTDGYQAGAHENDTSGDPGLKIALHEGALYARSRYG